jgi:microcystin degradation protein MlrC
MTRLRVFVGALGAEVNTFSPILIDRAAFESGAVYHAGQIIRGRQPPLMAAPLRRAWTLEKEGALEVVQGLCAGAQPGGVVGRQTYEDLREELLNDIRTAGAPDIVILGLHGATVAGGYDDVEGDLLTRARAIIGPDVVLAGLLDPHCHLTASMLREADLLMAYKEYPHTDVFPVADRLVDAAVAAARGEQRPVMRAWDCRMISVLHTTRSPARELIDELLRVQDEGGVIDISIAQSFPWGDVADLGCRVWATTDADPDRADALAERFARALVDMRGDTRSPILSASAAVQALRRAKPGPVVIADSADNPGGGAPSDATYLLRALLDDGARDIAAGLFWDPGAVAICEAAGVGAEILLRLGGKVCNLSGEPLDLQVEVTRLNPEAWQPFAGGVWKSGRAAAVRTRNGVEVVLTTLRAQCLDQAAFTQMGIELTSKRAVMVKSSQHFHASFSQLTDQILYVEGQGALSCDFPGLPYRHVRRPIWPLDVHAPPRPFAFNDCS